MKRCVVCGCTDLEPCILLTGETCSWAVTDSDEDICSFCAEEEVAPQADGVEIYSEAEAAQYLRARAAAGGL